MNSSTQPAAGNDEAAVVKFDGSAAMISPEVDQILGKFHAEMFALSEAARAKGDPISEAMSAYIHDRFCIVRCRLNDHEPPDDLTPYPRFISAGFVIAPKEPTAEMLEAGETGIDSDCKLECSAERVYRAMIAKATGAKP